MAFIDLIKIFKEKIVARYTSKNQPASISKLDHASSFDDIADLLVDVYNSITPSPTDENKTLLFDSTNPVVIDWQNNFVPGSTSITFAVMFGESPKFTGLKNNLDNTYTDITDMGILRIKASNQVTLLSVAFNFGPFPITGEIIIN